MGIFHEDVTVINGGCHPPRADARVAGATPYTLVGGTVSAYEIQDESSNVLLTIDTLAGGTVGNYLTVGNTAAGIVNVRIRGADNQGAAIVLSSGTDDYLIVDSTTGSERLILGSTVDNPHYFFASGGEFRDSTGSAGTSGWVWTSAGAGSPAAWAASSGGGGLPHTVNTNATTTILSEGTTGLYLQTDDSTGVEVLNLVPNDTRRWVNVGTPGGTAALDATLALNAGDGSAVQATIALGGSTDDLVFTIPTTGSYYFSGVAGTGSTVLYVDATSGQDPSITFSSAGVATWAMGYDNSANDRFHITKGAWSGVLSSDVMAIDSVGQWASWGSNNFPIVTHYFGEGLSSSTPPATAALCGTNSTSSAQDGTSTYICGGVTVAGGVGTGGTIALRTALTDTLVTHLEIDHAGNLSGAAVVYGSVRGGGGATTITTAGTPVKDASPAAFDVGSNMDDGGAGASNRIRYTGTATRTFFVTVSHVYYGTTIGAAGAFESRLHVNGSVHANVIAQEHFTSTTGEEHTFSLTCLISLATNDYIEVFVDAPTNGDQIYTTYLNMIARAIT